MTTNHDADRDYEILRRVALLIEDEVAVNAVPLERAKDVAKEYVRTTLDDGWISSADDVPVWELVELLGYDRTSDDFDPFVVMEDIAARIDDCDFFND